MMRKTYALDVKRLTTGEEILYLQQGTTLDNGEEPMFHTFFFTDAREWDMFKDVCNKSFEDTIALLQREHYRAIEGMEREVEVVKMDLRDP